MVYTPAPSVTTVRVFSISAGLEASTVTPGSTAPEASLTTPEILACPCACEIVGTSTAQANTNATASRRMSDLLGCHIRPVIEMRAPSQIRKGALSRSVPVNGRERQLRRALRIAGEVRRLGGVDTAAILPPYADN